MGDDVQEAARKGLLSMGGDKQDRIMGTIAPLTSNQEQCIGYNYNRQQFIDEATTVSKKCIYKLVFIGRHSTAHREQGATKHLEVVV